MTSRWATWKFTIAAGAVELGLGVAALVLGWLVGPWPHETLVGSKAGVGELGRAAAWGLIATVPLAVGLWWADRSRWAPLVQLGELVRCRLVPYFAPLSVWQLLLISLAAGLGEELLFRGWLQMAVVQWWPYTGGREMGLITAALLFGICHWLSGTYAVLATLMGLYMGVLFIWSDHLLPPIITHGAYDFWALLYLTRIRGNGSGGKFVSEDKSEEISSDGASG